MKKSIIIFLTLILTASCESGRIEKLNNRISELEGLNKKLSDSLNRVTYERLINSTLWGIPENKELKINEPNKFKFIFSSIQELPNYKVFAITGKEGNKSKTLIYNDYTKSEFEYNFIPKNEKDNSFEVKAFFPLDSILVEIPGKIKIK